jgi:predicted DNA-binding transcriptional regulator AlpA
MPEITFEQLPQAVTQLYNKLENIERLLLEKSNEPQPDPDRWFDLDELCNYLPDKPAKATVYGYIHFGKIPYHKGQKKLRFLKSEIDVWLMQGRKKTFAETTNEAEQYLNKKRLTNGK